LENKAVNIFRSKYFIWPLALVTAALIGILVYFSSIGEKVIFPNTGNYSIEHYTDEPNGGNSQVTGYEVSDSIIKLDFVLKDGFQSPYVGLDIIPTEDGYIDVRKYNQLDVKVLGENVDRIGISLYTPPLVDDEVDSIDERLFNANLNISNHAQVYHIPIDQFQHPDWWEDQHHISATKENSPDLGKILHMNLGSAYSSKAGNRKTLKIYAIAFSRNNNTLYVFLVLLYVAYILLSFGALYFLRYGTKKTKNVMVTYNPLKIDNKEEGNGEKCIEYINEHYDNGDLTLEVVSKETGTTTRWITHVIHEKFGCNFKTYINQIRINESKRFLTQTDLNIGEIAYKVGFNNQSHFNRVFKKELGISPSEFRNDHKGEVQ
tara:strand:+ start:44157 stop:45284 length:1128 start_codon:yes stop_codon:yes gene_type:complete